MTLVARLAFLVLVLATFGAFFITQALKTEEPLVSNFHLVPKAISPNGDGEDDRVAIQFQVPEADQVTLSALDEDGEAVRRIVANRSVPGNRNLEFFWDGRTDEGKTAPDGIYQFRASLRGEGRSVVIPGRIRIDTTAPEPRITEVNDVPVRGREVPTIVPAGRATPISIRIYGITRSTPELVVERTDDAVDGRVVARAKGTAGEHVVTWDGRVDGRPAPPGSYRLRALVFDRAQVPGLSAPRADGIGVVVRDLAVQPPAAPVKAGRVATFYVDARGSAYDWALRRTGSGKAVASGRTRGYRLRLRTPRGPSGLFTLTVRTGDGDRMTVPLAVDDRSRRAVLVVLPAATWQGAGELDEDGDGVPNTLRRGEPVAVARPYSATPAGVAEDIVPLLGLLDAREVRYDLTTDVALASGAGTRLGGHRGVLLAGRSEWIPAPVARDLRSFVEDGGRAASFSVGSLRRTVGLTGGRLESPSPLQASDVLGSRLGPVVRGEPQDIVVVKQDGGLFDGVDGLFAAWPAYEPTRAVAGGRLLDSAGPAAAPGVRAIVSYALGDGRVYRVGLPGWSERLADATSDEAALTLRAVELLAG